ncbi:hypothetical protein ACH4E8_01490 [Streptomyces sp. NPDC017979]|uniref:hypothetical protein n=1 Tax=Streptomyces sp. NPDC017979 TaxID=3365024 RepID=UPI0037B8E8C7
MQGDVTPLTGAGTGADGDGARAKKGPRHAAPKKSLLTKLQRPAGRAIALAAMPTAVFVGMGLTPKAALADNKDIPFAPGPCVTRSDEPQQSAEPEKAEKDAKPEKPAAPGSPKPSESAEPSDEPAREPEPAPGESAAEDAREPEPEDDEEPGEAPSAAQATEDAAGAGAPPSPQAAPSSTKSRDPWDPLGVGDALKDLFGVGDEGNQSAPPPPTTPPPKATPPPAPDPKPSTEPSKEPDAPRADGHDTAREGGDGGGTEKAIRKAAEQAGAEVEELAEDAKGLEPKKDEDIPDGAKPRFPCPTPDPEALADAELEPGIPDLPDQPWILKSTKLTLAGLDYKGIVEVKTGGGKVKPVLKFTASSIDIKDLHQLVDGPDGTTLHATADEGSTSTIRNGTVTMYTEELKGNLFGIIPVTFSPEKPPPLNVPLAIFTDVTVRQAGQFGGTLTIPGLHNYFTPGHYDPE